MAKKETVEAAQGVGVAKTETVREVKNNSLEKFSNDLGNYITLKQSSDIFSSGVFEEEGIDATSKMASVKDFWNEHKGEELKFIASGISTEPEGKNGPYDIVSGMCLTNQGELFGLSIPQTMITSSIKRLGLGAYSITYLGMERGKENDYANFKITLKKLFKASIEG